MVWPRQESLIKERSPDLVIMDIHFWWNVDVATNMGVSCIKFHTMGTFPSLACLAYHTLPVGSMPLGWWLFQDFHR